MISVFQTENVSVPLSICMKMTVNVYIITSLVWVVFMKSAHVRKKESTYNNTVK